MHIFPKQILYNFKHYGQYYCMSSANSLTDFLFFSSPGLNKGPAESIWGPDREGDEEIHPADPPRGLLPAQQHDCTQRHQR